MPDTTLIEPLRGTVGYTRKVNLGNYEMEEASLYVQFDINPDASIDAIMADATEAFEAAKATVYDQLGIGAAHDKGTATLAAVKEVFSGAQIVDNVSADAVVVTAPTAPAGDWFGKRGKSSPKTQINGQDGWDLLASDPEAFYDNRPQKQSGAYKPNAPDFKHKDSGIGLWQ